MNHVRQSRNVLRTEQAIHEDNERNSPQAKLRNLGSQCGQHNCHNFAKRNASHTPGNSNSNHVQEVPQEGHDNLLGIGGSLGSLFTGRLRSHRIDCKLAAVRDLLGFLFAIRNLNNGQHLCGSGTGICAHRFGVHLDVNIGAFLDQGLNMSGHIGIIGSSTLLCLLNHQHY